MSWSQATMVTNFDAEAGAVSSLATTSEKTLWWNMGQARLRKFKPKTQDITWAAADRSVSLTSDFIELQKIVTANSSVPQPWRVFGETLVMDDSDGATAAGSARVYYWAEWPEMTAGAASELTIQEDQACLNYALYRFYGKLASNRFYYKRYATLVGANAVSASDLQQEGQRYYQDFLDAREDVQAVPPAFYFED